MRNDEVTSLVFVGKSPKVIANSPLNTIADKHVTIIRRHFIAQMQRLQDKVPVNQVANLIANGHSSQHIIDLIPIRQVFGTAASGAKAAPKQSMQQFLQAELTTILVDSGAATVDDVAEILPAIGVVGPGALAADSAAWAAQNGARTIKGLSVSTKNAIRATITSGIVANRTPQQIAKDIQTIVGLRAPQAAALLAQGERLAAGGMALGDVAARLAQVKTGMLTSRAMTIARTETINAANGGQQLAWQIAQRQGILTDENSRKRWLVTFDDLLDEVICAPMPDMAENLDVKLDEWFTTGAGFQVESPTAHPNCRCAMGLEVLE